MFTETLPWLLWQAQAHLPTLATAMPELAPLFQVGAIGAILAYLLLKTEPRLRSIEAALDRNTRGQMLFLLAFEQVGDSAKMSEALKKQAQGLLQEIENAEHDRTKGA